MMSLAERVLAIIEARLHAITIAHGYATDAGSHVFRARRTLDDDELPALVVWFDDESVNTTTAAGNASVMDVALQVTVDAHVEADQDETGYALEQVRADVKRAVCIEPNGALRDAAGAVGVLTYTGTDSQARSEGAGSEAVAVHFTANYREAYGDPTRSR